MLHTLTLVLAMLLGPPADGMVPGSNLAPPPAAGDTQVAEMSHTEDEDKEDQDEEIVEWLRCFLDIYNGF